MDDCTVAGQTATCPRDGVVQVFIEVGDGDDTVVGGPGDDVILGGEGGDTLRGGDGDDFFDMGLGQNLPPEEQFAFDSVNGDLGFNTLSFASRTSTVRTDGAGNPIGIMIDWNPARDFIVDTDGAFKGITDSIQRLVGTQFDDEIVGGYAAEELVGGAGKDTLCGGLGVDTVDYSDRTSPVHVTLDGDRATDPRPGDSACGRPRREPHGSEGAVPPRAPRLP